jgi:hypothetical protein
VGRQLQRKGAVTDAQDLNFQNLFPAPGDWLTKGIEAASFQNLYPAPGDWLTAGIEAASNHGPQPPAY